LAFEADVADAANAANEDVRFFGASSAINWSESYSKSEFCSRVRYIARGVERKTSVSYICQAA